MVALYRTVIIEDDAVITQLNKRYVEKDSRFQVVRTFSAAHPALFWLRSNPVDLIILDVYMPQMSGLELLRALRAEGVDADVIMVTSANDAATIEAFMRLGVADYLIKPFDMNVSSWHCAPFATGGKPSIAASLLRICWIMRCCTSTHPPKMGTRCPKACKARR